MFVMNNNDKLGNMKKKHSKIYIMYFTLLLCLICNGCTEKKNNDDKKIEENNEIVLIKTMLNNSIVSEDELTPDEMVSNTILEKTEINLIEEYETYMVIKVTYPDAASLVIEALGDMEQEYDNEKMNSVYEKVAQKLKSVDVKMKEETLQVSFEIDDNENKQVVWSTELMNALSGGLYELMMSSR